MISPLTDKEVRKLVYDGGAEPKEMSVLETSIPRKSQSEIDEDQELLSSICEHEEYTPLEFADPIELLFFIDDNFRLGRKHLHQWQSEELLRLAQRGVFTIEEPLKYCLTAANGSGKDAFVIAIYCLWAVTCVVRSRTVVTSASYTQLKNQTENYIRSYGNRLNVKLAMLNVHPKACIIKKEHVGCNLTGAEIIMFVTDDPGRAEGFHPHPDYSHNIGLKQKIVVNGKTVYPGGDLTIIQNEAKTIPDDIDDALGRCTYNRLLKISSPGHTAGHFYNDYRRSVCYPQLYDKSKIYSRRVTSYDCPHISRIKIEQDKIYYGENSPIFRSKHLALFTSVGEQVVILRESLTACLEAKVEKLELKLGRRAGLDLAQGGDENCLYVFEENVLIGYEAFTMEDTHGASKIILGMFQKWKLTEGKIWADDGVAGHGHIDNLWAAGWNINRVRNQSPAIIKQHYGNRGAELWFNFARLVQERVVNLDKAPQKAIDQLSSRYYKQQETLGKLILESKKEARANGHSSPDHADAIILAMAGITIEDFRGHKINKTTKKETVTSPMEAVMRERDKQFDRLLKPKKSSISGRNFQSLMKGLYD